MQKDDSTFDPESQVWEVESEKSETKEETDSDSTSCSKHVKVWSRKAILTLIDLYGKYPHKFQNTLEKNDKVWQLLTAEMRNRGVYVTATQCRDKRKYLKMRYMKKKDNMGAKSSGSACINFEYFDEFDELFGKDHNVKPLAMAASVEGNNSNMNVYVFIGNVYNL